MPCFLLFIITSHFLPICMQDLYFYRMQLLGRLMFPRKSGNELMTILVNSIWTRFENLETTFRNFSEMWKMSLKKWEKVCTYLFDTIPLPGIPPLHGGRLMMSFRNSEMRKIDFPFALGSEEFVGILVGGIWAGERFSVRTGNGAVGGWARSGCGHWWVWRAVHLVLYAGLRGHDWMQPTTTLSLTHGGVEIRQVGRHCGHVEHL